MPFMVYRWKIYNKEKYTEGISSFKRTVTAAG